MNIARIGLERLNRVFKIRIRKLKRNCLEAIRIVSEVRGEVRRELESKKSLEIGKENGGWKRSKSENRIELLGGDVEGKEKRAVFKSPFVEEEGGQGSESKTSTIKLSEGNRISTQQSSRGKAPQTMYFKKLKESIMGIKAELNQIQKVNEQLQ